MKELLITAQSPKKWYVFERPEGKNRVSPKDIIQLYSANSQKEATAYALGRHSITGQTIVVD